MSHGMRHRRIPPLTVGEIEALILAATAACEEPATWEDCADPETYEARCRSGLDKLRAMIEDD